MKLKQALFILPLTLSAAPVAVLAVACASTDSAITTYNLLPTYTGQADQLIALGIKPDYYPVQLDASAAFPYLTEPRPFMVMQSNDFITRFSAKLRALTPSDQGSSWWNQQALDATEKGSSPEFWSRKSGAIVLYEHYLLDDGEKSINAATAPKHSISDETFIETNFRNSRDPYTRIPKNIIEGLLDADAYAKLNAAERAVVSQLLETGRGVEGTSAANLAVDGKPAPSGRPVREASEAESWLYNDFVFARFWHNNFLHNAAYQTSSFKAWEIDPTTASANSAWTFSAKPNEEALLKRLFYAATYRDTEASLKALATANLPATTATLAKGYSPVFVNKHHPIYEQQEEIGGAPMFEGAMRDNLLYLFTLAERVAKAASENTEKSRELAKVFASTPERWASMKNALVTANKISRDFTTRMAEFKKLVDAANNPTLGILTVAPGAGAGESTVQSSSKFSFLYREIGFNQPMPTNLATYAQDLSSVGTNNSFFNMDDNGWWWNLSKPNLNISSDSAALFNGQFDLAFFTANDAQFDTLKADEINAINTTLKTPFVGSAQQIHDQLKAAYKVDYNLWNEGLKAPFGLHMLLDQVLAQFNTKYQAQLTQAGGPYTTFTYTEQLTKAAYWGDYFSQEFINS